MDDWTAEPFNHIVIKKAVSTTETLPLPAVKSGKVGVIHAMLARNPDHTTTTITIYKKAGRRRLMCYAWPNVAVTSFGFYATPVALSEGEFMEAVFSGVTAGDNLEVHAQGVYIPEDKWHGEGL